MEKIILEEIKAYSHVGISEKERAKKQKILVSVYIEPEKRSVSIKDSIDNTINYSNIKTDVKNILKTGTFNLIETVAERVAHHIKRNYSVKNVTIYVKKFPYRDTKYVGYRLTV